MMNGTVKFVLGLAQVPDAAIADLDKNLPGMARLADAARELEPILQEAMPHIVALEPLMIRATPIVQKAWPDLVAVTPTVQEFIAFINSRKG